MARLTVPTAGISGFINNTPLVAMLIGEVTNWCRKHKISPSRLLMPLSFAAIMGGTLTVIGTSTNLVVSGLLENSGREGIGLFEITAISGLSVLTGIVLLIALAPVLVPERITVDEHFGERMREFIVEMEVEASGKLDGATVEAAGLRHLEGVYLIEIDRGRQLIAPVTPTTTLGGGDRLTFVGQADLVVDLQRIPGLRSAQDKHLLEVESADHTFFEAVIGANSPLAGRTLIENDFRARYQAAVVAIHRAGERVQGKLGEVRLRAGDTLLLLAGRDFRSRWRERSDFLLVARLGGAPPSASRKAPIVAATAVSVIVLAAFEVMDIVELALLAAAVIVLTRVLTVSEARNAIDWDVIIMIGAAFGVGEAMSSSGLAERTANGLVDLLGPMGELGIIAGVVIATIALTEMITNNAAAVVMFPITVAVATSAGLDPRIVAMAVAVAASNSFLTPLGYQTNTMVYGPGGYRFLDYVRAGLPLTIAVMVPVVLMTWAQA